MPTPTKYPRRAFLVSITKPDGYGDALTAVAVLVLGVDGDKASVARRSGNAVLKYFANTADLASTPEKAIEKITAHLTALASRPLHLNVAGMTEAGAATASTEGKK